MAIRLFEKDEVKTEFESQHELEMFEHPDPSKEGPCVIMMSGGVESTAILQWAKDTNWFEPIICVHSVWKDINISSSKQVNANIPKICEYYDVPLYVYEQSDPLQNYVDQKWNISQIESVHSAKHWLLTAMNIAARYPSIKQFFWGVNCGLKQPGIQGDYHFLARANEWNMCFNAFAYSMSENTGQRLVPPLSHLTKKQLWDMIDDEVKPLVQSCGYPQNYDGTSPCGSCNKCMELLEINGELPKLEENNGDFIV